MRWTPGGTSSDVEDERGSSGGGFGGAPIGIGGALILLVLSLIFGRNFFSLVDTTPRTAAPARPGGPVQESPQEHRQVQFVSFTLDDVQATWDSLLPQQARTPYQHAKLVLFRDAWPSACGYAETATGPFYCPSDQKVYLDLSFYDELKSRFGAPGEFAQAYVLAHEIGHHVQDLVGTTDRVEQAMRDNPRDRNALSVRLELQADCYAGVWGHSGAERNLLEPGDLESGLAAASAVGDDRLQKMAGRRVNSDSFTHGSSEERVRWFRRGFESGRMTDCNTFARGN